MRKLPVLLGIALFVLLAIAVAPAAAHQGSTGRAQQAKKGKHHRGKKQSRLRNSKELKCNGTVKRKVIQNVTVPRNGACTLKNSTVKGDVSVLANAYFEASNSTIRGNVRGKRALTIFVHDQSRVGGVVQADKTPQLFLFKSTVKGDVQIRNAISDFGHVQICGMTVLAGDIHVEATGRDILIGDTQAEGCPGNTVRRGNVEVQRNFTDIELVVRGNSIPAGNLEVFGNTGPAEKFVQFNTGGKVLECGGNNQPFVGSLNTGWLQTVGQCQ